MTSSSIYTLASSSAQNALNLTAAGLEDIFSFGFYILLIFVLIFFVWNRLPGQ